MNYKIMIIEDDPDIAELVSRHLEKFGFTIEKCIEFHNVLKEFEKQNHIWCCWILICLPMMDFTGAEKSEKKVPVRLFFCLPVMQIRIRCMR